MAPQCPPHTSAIQVLSSVYWSGQLPGEFISEKLIVGSESQLSVAAKAGCVQGNAESVGGCYRGSKCVCRAQVSELCLTNHTASRHALLALRTGAGTALHSALRVVAGQGKVGGVVSTTSTDCEQI